MARFSEPRGWGALAVPGGDVVLQTISPQPSEASIAPGIESRTDDKFHWTPGKICLSLFLFLVAGLAEIGGGWLVWQTIREHKAWWWAVLGALVLVAYGFVPTAQPVDNFGRVFAVYGGFFIILSYLWGWALDGDRPDKGDWIGSGIALAGVAVAWFWKR